SNPRPATKFARALTMPKPTMNESAAVLAATANSRSATRGSTARSSPTMPPTNAFTATSSQNCRQLRRRPSRGTGVALRAKVACADTSGILRRGRHVANPCGHERVAIVDVKRALESPLEPDRGRRLAAQAAAADGPGRAGPAVANAGCRVRDRRHVAHVL